MQTTCPISGEVFIKDDMLLGYDYYDEHPIFRVPRNELLTRELIFRFNKAPNTKHKKMYFLALVKSTDLVAFEHPASPSLKVIENNFLPIFDFACWLDIAYYTTANEISFPGYVVRKENADMENLYHWVNELLEIQKDFRKKDANKERRARLSNQFERITKDFHDAYLKDRYFTPYAARWAIEFAELDNHPEAETFVKYLQTPAKDAWGLDRDVLQRLQNLLVLNIPRNHPLTPHVFGQLRLLIAARARGLQDFQILTMDDKVEIDGVEVSTKRFVGEAYKEKFLKEHGSLQEPKLENFKTKIQYLVAYSSWKLAMTEDKKPEQTIYRDGEKLSEQVSEHFQEEQEKYTSSEDEISPLSEENEGGDEDSKDGNDDDEGELV